MRCYYTRIHAILLDQLHGLIALAIPNNQCPLQVLSAEEIAQKAIENAARAMTANLKVLSRQEALGQVASSALLQGGTISDEVMPDVIFPRKNN